MASQQSPEHFGNRYRYDKHYKLNAWGHQNCDPSVHTKKRCISEASQAFTDAIRAGNVDAVETLLHTKCILPRDYFRDAVLTDKCVELLDLFCHYGFEVNGPGSLPNACCPIWLQVVPSALSTTATDRDPCSTSPYGLDALGWLRDHGGRLNSVVHSGKYPTLLDSAAEYGSIEGIKLLIKAGADVTKTRVLPAAAGSTVINDDSSKAMMEYLLSEIGDVDVNTFCRPYFWGMPTEERMTALEAALRVQSHERIMFLLNHGANPCLGGEHSAIAKAREMASQCEDKEKGDWLREEADFLERRTLLACFDAP